MRFHEFVDCQHLACEECHLHDNQLLDLLLLPPTHFNNMVDVVVLGADVYQVEGVHVGGQKFQRYCCIINQMESKETISERTVRASNVRLLQLFVVEILL